MVSSWPISSSPRALVHLFTFPTQWWLTGTRGKTLVREAELDRAENSRSGGGFREEASGDLARIEVWQDFLHASEVVRGRLLRFEELCLSLVGLVLLLHFFSYPFEFRLVGVAKDSTSGSECMDTDMTA
ncbi:hypothetical protein Taro_040717 [Colocasia esculenta]|uniref:Uncharacterized protein n=1 Tax=Colocasia esculenta TaxID=4460 RepID=A0A843WYZ7_COLES|nr:hypothetical protein [Colocasia esculenta]